MAATQKFLIIVCGPTASGKTGVAIDLAEHFGTEIISCDSRQIYREMEIGTAVPSSEELSRIKHHFIQSHSMHDLYTAGQYERDVLALLDDIYLKDDIAISAGGTGLYIKAITEGFDDMPVVSNAIRESVIAEYEEHGLEHLQNQVKHVDPESFELVDQQNPQRLMRILEIFQASGKPRSAFISKDREPRRFRTLYIGLDVEREKLYERINERVDQMVDRGLIKEARDLYPHKGLSALQTVGYQELFDHFDGKISQAKAIELIKRNSRRYAKRQMTWFRRNEELRWFKPDQIKAMINYIDTEMVEQV